MCVVWINTENKSWDEYVNGFLKKRETGAGGQAVQAQEQQSRMGQSESVSL